MSAGVAHRECERGAVGAALVLPRQHGCRGLTGAHLGPVPHPEAHRGSVAVCGKEPLAASCGIMCCSTRALDGLRGGGGGGGLVRAVCWIACPWLLTHAVHRDVVLGQTPSSRTPLTARSVKCAGRRRSPTGSASRTTTAYSCCACDWRVVYSTCVYVCVRATWQSPCQSEEPLVCAEVAGGGGG